MQRYLLLGWIGSEGANGERVVDKSIAASRLLGSWCFGANFFFNL